MKDENATVIVDLRPTTQEIRMNFHKDVRWGIGKAERDGLTIRESTDDKDWEEVYNIYKEVIIDGGIKPKKLQSLKDKTNNLIVCEKGGEVIGGAGIRFFDMYNSEIPRLYFAVSSKKHLKSQPNNFLYWYCIIWSKYYGYDEFDLGGWQINAKGHLKGINEFKEKWGKVVYFDRDYPLIRAIGRKIIRRFK